MLDAIAQGGAGTTSLVDRLGEIDQTIQTATREAQELRAELDALDAQVVDDDELRAALESFDPIWDELFPPERARIMHLLIEVVTYDARAGEVAITFHPSGIRTLTEETT